jgi:hypothetical protein
MAKVKSFPCYCCTVTNKTLVTPQPKEKCLRGDRCMQAKCYHHPMLNENIMNGREHCKTDLETEFAFLRTIRPNIKESKVLLSTMEEFQDESSPFDIDFHPVDEDEAMAFKQLLIHELNLRGLPVNAKV